MEKLCKFLDYAHSTYHAVDYLKKELISSGYQPLSEGRTGLLRQEVSTL